MAGYEGAHGAVRLLVTRQTVLKGQAIQAPSHILPLIYMRTELLDIERKVPIYHILAHIKALFVMRSHSRIAIRLYVKRMRRMPRTHHIFEYISLFEFQVVEVDQIFEDTLAPFIFRHELDQLIDDALEVLIRLISQLCIGVQVHEVLHSLTLGIACLTDKSEEEQVSRQNLHFGIVQVYVHLVLSLIAS